MKRTLCKTSFAILLFVSATTFGQENIKFDNFIKLFPKTTLPTSILYAESEFKTDYYKPEDMTAKKDSIPFHDHILPKDTALIIKNESVKLFLLADTESVTPRYPDNNNSSDTIYPTYYVSTQLITNTNFACLVYERQFIVNGINNSEKYLCTITNSGKLIDKILVASAVYSGTGLLYEGFRVPWFPDTKSKINNDLTIVLDDQINGNLSYQINDKGIVRKTKASR